jgi:hypothetical protein
MMKIRGTVSGRLAAAALAAVAGLAGALAIGPAVSASPVAGKAAAATAPTWKVQAPPEPAGTTNQAFGAVSCSSSSACLALAINDYPKGFGGFAETWNGSHWTVQTVPDGQTADDLQGVKCRSAQWCMAVGTTASGDGYVPVADRWNGGAWTPTRPPAPAGAATSDLSAVACSGTTACTAIGQSAKGKAAPALLAERWNGSAWKIQPVPAPAGGGLLLAVACPAAHACRAVGSDKKGLFSEVWDGSSWVIRPVPVPAGGSAAALWGRLLHGGWLLRGRRLLREGRHLPLAGRGLERLPLAPPGTGRHLGRRVQPAECGLVRLGYRLRGGGRCPDDGREPGRGAGEVERHYVVGTGEGAARGGHVGAPVRDLVHDGPGLRGGRVPRGGGLRRPPASPALLLLKADATALPARPGRQVLPRRAPAKRQIA